MPDRYLLQLLRKLVNDGLLDSTRGVAGGYKLAKPANKITLLEIVEAVDGPVGLQERVDMPPMPGKLVDAVDGAFAASARRQLAKVTLADLQAAKAA